MAGGQLQFDAVVSAGQLNKLLAELRSGAEGAAKAINDALGGTVTKKLVLEEVANNKGTKDLIAVEKQRLSITDQLISKQRQLNKTQEGSVTSLKGQLRELTQARNAVQRYAVTAGGITGVVKQQRAEWAALNAQVSRVSRELAVASASGFWDRIKVATRSQGLINISNGLVELTQGLQAASILAGQFLGAINSIVDATAELQSFALAFKAIGAGGAGAVTGLQESSRVALGLGVELRTVQEGFRQLSPVVLNVGGDLGDVSSIVEALSSRFAAFGISGDRARRVLNGVIQAFSKGKLQAEELTQQISEADPAFKTDLTAALFASRKELGELGKQIDGTVPNLEKLVKAGLITSDVLIKVIPGLSKSALLFGKLGASGASAVDGLERGAVTIDQVRANLNNLNQLSLRELSLSAEPLILALLRVQATLTDTFTRIANSAGTDVLADIGGRAIEVFGRLADTLLVLGEGAVNVVGALKPIIDLVSAILSIPGATELAGVAILGNLLKPLNILEGRLERSKAAIQGFRNGFTGIFKGSAAAIAQVSDELKGIDKALGATSIGTNVLNQRDLDTLRAGSEETARFAQRQDALIASKRLLSTASTELARKLAEEEGTLKKLQQAQVQAAIAPVSDEARVETQNKISEAIERTGTNISILASEQNRLDAQSKSLNTALELNSRTVEGFGGAIKRTGAALRGGLAGGLNAVRGALGSLKSGFTSLLGLIDPLTAIIIAAGVGQRLYADGTKDATEAAKRFEDVNNVLSASLEDLAPGQEESAKASTALGRIWDRLASAAVRLGDVLSNVFEGFAGILEGSSSAVQSFAESVANSLGAVGTSFSAFGDSFTTFAAGAAGAIGGFAVAGPIGAAIGALGGVTLALAGSTSEAAAAQQELAKELAAVDAGSATTTEQVKKLAAAITSVQTDPGTGDIEAGGLQKAKAALDALRSAQEAQTKELDKTNAAYDINQTSVKQYSSQVSSLTAKIAEQESILRENQGAPSIFSEEAVAENEAARAAIAQYRQELKAAKDALTQAQIATGTLAASQEVQGQNLKETSDSALAAEAALKGLEEQNIKTADSTTDLSAAIKTLQDNNAALKITDPVDRKQFQENLQRIEAIKNALEELTKSDYEVRVEVRGQDEAIANNVAAITLDQGPLRDTRTTVNSITTALANASDNFAQKAQQFRDLVTEGTLRQADGAALTERAGADFLESITKSRAELADAARDLSKSLTESTQSLSSLILSKPEFFTPEEIRGAADQIERDFAAAIQRTGVIPNIQPGTPDEILRQKQEFVETRNRAEELNTTIKEINESLKLITASITGVSPLLDQLKQKGVDIASISQDAADALSGVGEGAPDRIAQVFGSIEVNGQKFIQFFDNATGQARSLEQAQFDALQAADRLASSGGQVADEFTQSPIEDLVSGLSDGANTSDQISSNLGSAADNASKIADSIKSLQGLTIDVKVNQIPGFFTGGEVTAGQQIRVNELGKEGFLSRGGQLSQINVPANATWRPPSSGTIIPAHMWKQINAPSGHVRSAEGSVGVMTARATSGATDLSGIVRRIEMSIARSNASGGTGELAAVQAQQAIEIGKLSRAVDKLAEKKWNVKAVVTSPGSSGYLSALNHRL
jgi:tape measure domain-containing protein